VGFRKYADHRDYEHKASYARELVDLKNLQIPILVDEMDQNAHVTLGNLPNIAYVVNKEARLHTPRPGSTRPPLTKSWPS